MHTVLAELGSQVNPESDPGHLYHLYKYPVSWFMYLVVRRSLAAEMTEITRYHRPVTSQLRANRKETLPTDQRVKSMREFRGLICLIILRRNCNASMRALNVHEWEIVSVSFFPPLFN